MEALFLKLFNMSITASWLVLAVVILRLLLKKAPKAVTVFLWALVGIRLVCPFSFESVLSLIPSAETLPNDILTTKTPAVDSGIPFLNQAVNPIISGSLAPNVGYSVNPMQVVAFIGAVFWLAGIAVMLIYTLISYLKIHRKVREAVPYNENIWVCDRIAAPFILGVFRPKIYLPSAIDKQDEEYVIAHERAHLKRRDHLIKPLGFLLLTVYWFNPVMWIAYILLCRDIELACDERVIKELGEQAKKPYSEALINCSLPRRTVAACPLAFGEVGVKSRIKSVLNYKKPAFWVVIVAIIASIAVAVGFLTNPKSNDLSNIANQNYGSELNGLSLEIVNIETSAPDPYLTIRYKNRTIKNLTYGAEFHIYQKIGDKWEDCRINQDTVWIAIGYHMYPGAKDNHQYNLNGQIMTQPGEYRFETFFSEDGNSDTKYKAWIEFELKKGVDGINVHTFNPTELVYNDGMYSYIQAAEDAPSYRLVNGMALQEVDDRGNVTSICSLERIELNNDNFNSRFATGWLEGYSLKELKKNNKRAWQQTVSEGGLNELYLLLEQNDGTFYLGYGYFDIENANKRNPDGSSIRWLYKLQKAVESPVDNETDSSELNRNYNPYFNATVLEVYESSVLVEPFEDTDERKSSDKITVNTNVVSTHPVPELKEGMQIRVVYNGTIEETYPANIPTAFAIYELREVDGKLEPVIATPPKSEAATSLIDSDIKEIYVLSRPSKGQIEKFTVSKTYTDNKLKQLKAFLTTEYCEEKEADNWVKFNPAHPNQTKLALSLSDGTTMIINIHFTEGSPYYIAIGTVEESFDTEKDYSDIEYTRYIAKAVFGEFLKSII